MSWRNWVPLILFVYLYGVFSVEGSLCSLIEVIGATVGTNIYNWCLKHLKYTD